MDWEIVEQQDAVVDKPLGDILNMDVSKAERLYCFLKNQYSRTVVQVNITSLTNLVYMYKQFRKHHQHYEKSHWCNVILIKNHTNNEFCMLLFATFGTYIILVLKITDSKANCALLSVLS